MFHQKFGYGHVAEIDGNKLTIDFDKAGRKRVVESFLVRLMAGQRARRKLRVSVARF